MKLPLLIYLGTFFEFTDSDEVNYYWLLEDLYLTCLMFTGIIEAQARVISIDNSNNNQIYVLESAIAPEFRIDESVAHNGVCLTVEQVKTDLKQYQVTAIEETLRKTNLAEVGVGEHINLERALPAHGRLDGHFVQGHVDCTATVVKIKQLSGSYEYTIHYPATNEALVIGRGSICMNGISLTIANNDPQNHTLSVCIIPHTLQRTNIKELTEGRQVNLEFDVLGKYVQKFLEIKKI